MLSQLHGKGRNKMFEPIQAISVFPPGWPPRYDEFQNASLKRELDALKNSESMKIAKIEQFLNSPKIELEGILVFANVLKVIPDLPKYKNVPKEIPDLSKYKIAPKEIPDLSKYKIAPKEIPDLSKYKIAPKEILVTKQNAGSNFNIMSFFSSLAEKIQQWIQSIFSKGWSYPQKCSGNWGTVKSSLLDTFPSKFLRPLHIFRRSSFWK